VAGFWDDFWGSINQKAAATPKYDPYGTGWDKDNDPAMAKTNAGAMINRPNPSSVRPPSNAMQTLRSVGNKLPGLSRTPGGGEDGGFGTRQGNDDIPESRYRDGPSEDEQRMEQLQGLLDREFQSTGEYDSMVDEAYASALANIGKARGQANSNFQESDGRIASLTAGHVNEIQTKDRAAVEKNGSDLQSAYKETYGNARNEIQGQQSAEMAAKTEMLQRLGQQEAGIGTAGQSESEALTRLTQNEAGAMQQAQGYQAADLTRNTEQAQSQASAGVERRSALNRDLQKILGTLDESEAEVNQNKTVAKLSGLQNEKSDFRQEQQFNLDSLTQMEDRIQGRSDKDREYALELSKLASKNGGSAGSKWDVLAEGSQSRGIDPAPYMEAYAEVSSMPFNSQVKGDKLNWTISEMQKAAARKGQKLDAREALRWVSGADDYGTDKLG
jgi:hypothetical protein